MHTLLISLSETPQVSKLALFVPQMQATRTRRRRRQTRDCVFPCTLMPFHGGHGFCSCSGIVLCSLCTPTPRPHLMLRNSQRQWRCDCHRSHHHKFWFLRRLLLRFCLPAAGNVRDCLNGLAHSTEAALHLHQRGDLAWLLPGLCLAGPLLTVKHIRPGPEECISRRRMCVAVAALPLFLSIMDAWAPIGMSSFHTPRGKARKNLFYSCTGTWAKCSLLIAWNFNLRCMQIEQRFRFN